MDGGNVRSATIIERSRHNLGAVAGVLGVAAPAAGLAVMPIWRFPGTNSSGAQISRFVLNHQSALHAVMVLNTIGVVLWLVFGAGVWLRLRRALGADSVLPTSFALGLVGFVTLIMAGFVAFLVLVYRPRSATDTRLLYDLTFGLLAMSGLPTAVSLGSYAAAVFRAKLRPRFTAELAVGAAAAHVALLFSFLIPTGFFSLEGQVITVVPALLFAWILATGITMLRSGRALNPAVRTSPPAG
jgi:hypothetical protein